MVVRWGRLQQNYQDVVRYRIRFTRMYSNEYSVWVMRIDRKTILDTYYTT
jgi:hypothetical protein